MPRPIIPPHGGYKTLITYRKSDIIFRGTAIFVRRFLKPGDRTIGQMEQAARSGKQNIIEGSEASATSKATELTLTNVAKASLEELLEDYLDYLKLHNLPEWPKDSPKGLAARRLCRDAGWDALAPRLESATAETAANLLVCLIRQCTYLLARQIAHLETDFTLHGGIRERMHAARTAARAATWETAAHSRLSTAHTPAELDALLSSMTDTLRRLAGNIRRKNAWPT